MKNNMLNLEIGKIYKFTTFDYLKFDYEVVDDSKEVVHTTINGKGRVARLKDKQKTSTKKKKINKDTINVKDKWLY